MIDYQNLSLQFKEKLKNIKVLAFDVDGILTDGRIWWQGEEVGWNRAFHSRDGYALKIMQKAGFKVGVITGGDSMGIGKRFKENLGVDFVFSGYEDKRDCYHELLKMDAGYEDENILYMGDEHFDMPLLKKAGFSATVATASPEVLEVVDYVTTTPAGMGCVREVIDIIRFAHNIKVMAKDFGE